MHSSNLEGILSMEDCIIVELNPSSASSQLRSWEFGKWGQVQAVHTEPKYIDKIGYGNA